MEVSDTSNPPFELVAPLAGWVLPLSEVPDPVFASATAGDGVAIDPVGESLHAPCDGTVVLMGNNRHALTIKSQAGDVLLHVGIDTVQLAGSGFELQVREGEAVRSGQLLMAFDLDLIVRRAPSAITPILLTGQYAGRIIRRQSARRVAVGDFLLAAEPTLVSPRSAMPNASGAPMLESATRSFRVPFEHGLHARPAARVAAALAGLNAAVMFHGRGREANARSVVAMMALGVGRGDVVTATAAGPDAEAALDALSDQLESVGNRAALHSLTLSGQAMQPPAAGARLPGLIAARGFVVGVAAPLVEKDPPAGEARGDSATERARLVTAIDTVSRYLTGLAAASQDVRRNLLDAHLLLLADPQLLGDAEELLAGGASAGLAWRTALRSAADALAGLEDPRMDERRADLRDIENQVLRALSGTAIVPEAQLPQRAIVIAAELLPSQLLSFDSTRLVGLCTAAGGATSHMAILAASMGLPTLVAAGPSVLAIAAGTPLLLDAEAGFLLVSPPAEEQERLDALVQARARTRVQDEAAAQQPAITRDGVTIQLYCNLGATEETAPAVRAGAEGCGLLRTEFLFQARKSAPTEAEQLEQYQNIASALGGRSLTIRTLDAGGDKPLPYMASPHEENPALGMRGLRSSLTHPGLLATQLRAIVRVAPAGQCRVLLPMVTELEELRSVRAQLRLICQELGLPLPPLGVMIETPAAALLVDQLAAECEFIAIGTNDLSQYTLAMDRLHPNLAPRLDGLHPAVLRLIDRTMQILRDYRVEAGVCGGLASDPEAIPLLIGMGVRELSVVPAQIPRTKGLLRKLDFQACVALSRQALALTHAAAVRELVREWNNHNV